VYVFYLLSSPVLPPLRRNLQAFEQLVQRRVFVSVAPPSTAIAKEFVRYRCTVDRAEVKRAVDTIGQTNLKKWFAKAG
jgi:origin recognition complex subunit 4